MRCSPRSFTRGQSVDPFWQNGGGWFIYLSINKSGDFPTSAFSISILCLLYLTLLEKWNVYLNSPISGYRSHRDSRIGSNKNLSLLPSSPCVSQLVVALHYSALFHYHHANVETFLFPPMASRILLQSQTANKQQITFIFPKLNWRSERLCWWQNIWLSFQSSSFPGVPTPMQLDNVCIFCSTIFPLSPELHPILWINSHKDTSLEVSNRTMRSRPDIPKSWSRVVSSLDKEYVVVGLEDGCGKRSPF